MPIPSSAHEFRPSWSWWCFSVESTLAWPSLRPYNLPQEPWAATIDLDDENDIVGQHANPNCASLRLPPYFHDALLGPSRGALDDRAEMTQLVDRFMKHIHAKQPVLDPHFLYNEIAVIEEEGLGWDAATCLLLMACALGAICMPYDISTLEDYSKPSISTEQYLRSREYFDAGRKRLGLVMGHASIIGAQCFFLAAGYYMTAFRPMAAWRSLHTASVICKNVLIKTLDESTGRNGAVENTSNAPDNSHRKLFWSCLKTEREIANELGFDIANIQLIQYETPPSLLPESNPHLTGENGELQLPPPTVPEMLEGRGLTAEEHEQSWFYYLTDVSLRKLEMHIYSFFRLKQSKEQQAKQREPAIEDRESFYRDVLVTLADLDEQILGHSVRLPTSITVETDESGHSPDDLREYLRLRMIIIRHDLSRPALHFILHDALEDLSAPLRAHAVRIANRALSIDEYLITHGLTTHRHPGTWLGIRYCTRAALELFAASKKPVPDLVLPPTWELGMQKFKTALTYWSAECKDARIYLDWLVRLESTA